MDGKISTRIVDSFWLDNDTYVVCCDSYRQTATDGTMGRFHLEVEYWDVEKSFHFIVVAEECNIFEPSLDELPQKERDKLIEFIQSKIAS